MRRVMGLADGREILAQSCQIAAGREKKIGEKKRRKKEDERAMRLSKDSENQRHATNVAYIMSSSLFNYISTAPPIKKISFEDRG